MEQQYRDLTFDDFIQPGDEVWAFGAGPWKPVSMSEHGQQYRNGYWRMRRPVAAEETITEVREAWLKDHMEMKRKLDGLTEGLEGMRRNYEGECERVNQYSRDKAALRRELVDARNQITDLQRRLEDALSDKAIAQSGNRTLADDRDRAHKDIFAYAEFTRNIAAELGLGTLEISFKEVITSVKQFRKDLCNTTTMLMKANSENHDLKINLDSAEARTESYRGLVTDIGNMFGLRARISDDGTICEDVLALRVPELVAELIVENS